MTTEITHDDIDRSHQLHALLRVCRATADQIEEQTRGEVKHLANSIALALEVAERMAGDLHDKLEFAAPRHVRFCEPEPEAEPCA